MNYLSMLLVISGLFLSTNTEKHNKVNFENLKNVDSEFVDFLSAFDKVTLPYEMNLLEVEEVLKEEPRYMRNQNQILTNTLLENRGAFVSRMGPPVIQPLKRFYPTKKTVAVTYIKKNRFGSATGVIMLAVFNLKGKLLSFKEKVMEEDMFKSRGNRDWNFPLSISDYDNTETFRITEDGLIHKTKYSKLWKKDWKEFGIIDNEVFKTQLVSQEILQFGEDGNISKLDKKGQHELAAANVKGRAE